MTRRRPGSAPWWAPWVTLVFAAVLAGTTIVAWQPGGAAPAAGPGARVEPPAVRFVEAWERSRRATFVREGAFERRSADGRTRLRSPDLLAQDPPRRLHRQFGGVEGRVGDRLVLCPAGPHDARADRCGLGPPSGRTFDEAVVDEVRAVRAAVVGPSASYEVSDAGAGCFALDAVRVSPTASFGVRARFCFDAATGAPTTSVVRHAAGVVESLRVQRLAPDPAEGDLRP